MLQAVGRERVRRRRLTTGLGLLAAACATALIVIAPGRRVIFTSGTALTEGQIKNLQITQPNGPAILALNF